MSPNIRLFWALSLSGAIFATGCQPVQPFFFMEDGDLSHFVDVATDIEYPDVCEPTLAEVAGTLPPLTLENFENSQIEIWEVSLEEVTRYTLCNSQVMRQLGGRVASSAPETISRTLVSPVAVTTTYDPALIESATGTSVGSPFGATGVEAALSEFDAQLDASVFWQKNDRPQNRPNQNILFPPVFEQDFAQFTSGITKVTAPGTQFSFRNNTQYDRNNSPADFRPLASDWTTNFEASFSHPFFQGAGTEYNRIAGPMSFDQYAAGGSNPFDGVVIARIRVDTTLADFEGGVRNLMRDVEDAYWELYFAYRDLHARKLGRDSALATWKRVHALFLTGSRGGDADREAQARTQYYQFRAQVEQAFTELLRAESRLRYIMGLSPSDGRLIRPSDEPTIAQVDFDWAEIHSESLVRRVEVRKQKWEIKRRELELVASRNHLLPRLDAVGRYRWLGLGDNLIDPSRSGVPFNAPGSTAFEVLTGGNYQEWELGLQLQVPIGFRRPLSTVRHHELLLARERAILQDLELEVGFQLQDAIRGLSLNYALTETNANGRVASEREVQAVQAAYDVNRVTFDTLLDAQRRRADAESAYFRSLVDYNKAIMDVHYRKGSLLEYNGVYLAEGPWPRKAYFDALRRARQRDASMYLDYGFTRPRVFSQGSYAQDGHGGQATMSQGEGFPGEFVTPEEVPIETNGPGQPLPPPSSDFGSPVSVPPTNQSSDVPPAISFGNGQVMPAQFESPTYAGTAGYVNGPSEPTAVPVASGHAFHAGGEVKPHQVDHPFQRLPSVRPRGSSSSEPAALPPVQPPAVAGQ